MLNSFTNSKEYGAGPGFSGVGPGITVVNNIDAYAVNTDWKKAFLDKEKLQVKMLVLL
jgi:hypothetical protein